ncbi:MAG: CvpA family protein [Lachnospiraceae bacterium]|nr:CvpA family protein [Lachnospiraceae bacterium]
MDNLVVWLVIGELILFGLIGFFRGFVKMAYGCIAIVISITLVSLLTPYVKDMLLHHTNLYEQLSKSCTEAIEEKYSRNESEKPKDEEDVYKGAGIVLPSGAKMLEGVLDKGKEAVSGIYEQVGSKVAMWILCAIAFVVTLLIVQILIHVIGGVLHLISKLPIIHGVDKIAGAAAGLMMGVLILWIIFVVLSTCCTSEKFDFVFRQIEENPITGFLYQNNLIVNFVVALVD